MFFTLHSDFIGSKKFVLIGTRLTPGLEQLYCISRFKAFWFAPVSKPVGSQSRTKAQLRMCFVHDLDHLDSCPACWFTRAWPRRLGLGAMKLQHHGAGQRADMQDRQRGCISGRTCHVKFHVEKLLPRRGQRSRTGAPAKAGGWAANETQAGHCLAMAMAIAIAHA